MKSRPLVLVHDREASRVPWEVLRLGDTHPALGQASVVVTPANRYRSQGGAKDRSPGPLRVLLIVDPTGDLPGAAAEGDALRDCWRGGAVTLDVLEGAMRHGRAFSPRSAQAPSTCCTSPATDSSTPRSRRAACSATARKCCAASDLDGIGNLPALVFCNACEAARVRKRPRGRVQSARLFGMQRSMTGIAEAFLAGGVANFVGTHWPVGDEAAFAFSQALYHGMLQGERLAMRCSRRGGASKRFLRSTGPTTCTTAARSSASPSYRDVAHAFIVQALRSVPADGRMTCSASGRIAAVPHQVT